jgi:hypothetical protein
MTSIVAAGWTGGGLPYVDLLESRRGDPGWAVPMLEDLCARHDCRALVIDSISAANTLIDPLRRAGVTVTTTNAGKMAAAAGGFYDRVIAGQLRHLGQPALSVALSAARKRRVGDGWAWNRATSADDITGLVAATLALWALESSEVAAKPKVRTGHAVFV